MFRRLSEPLPLSEASLLALRPALNAPVLNVGFLPVGPARAALVVFAEEYGAIGIAFGIRSVEGRQVAVLRNQEPIEETAALSEALEPALAEAERMGFLFDEDMLAESTAVARAAAASLWADLMGEPEAESQPRAAVPEDGLLHDADDSAELDDLAELMLEEVASVDLADVDQEIDEIALDLEAAPGSCPSAAAGAAGGHPGSRGLETEDGAVRARVPETRAASLSKFRSVPSRSVASSGPPSTTGEAPAPVSALGRVALKRVRGGGRDGAARRIPYLARLLSSF